MRRINSVFCAILAVLALFLMAPTASALQVIAPMEGESTFVNISKLELNMIQFPFSGIRAYTSSQKIEIKVQGRHVMASMLDQNEKKPQEVFFDTQSGTYLLMLVPKGIPAETIIMKIRNNETESADDWEKGNDYERRLKELVKALYLGKPPSGFVIRNEKADASIWEGIEQTVVMTMEGAGMIGEIHDMVNHGDSPVRFTESEFYEDGVLAVSLSSMELRPGGREQAFVVRRKSAVNRNNGRPLRSKSQMMASRESSYDYNNETAANVPPHLQGQNPPLPGNSRLGEEPGQQVRVSVKPQPPAQRPDAFGLNEEITPVTARPAPVVLPDEEEEIPPVPVKARVSAATGKKSGSASKKTSYRNKKTYSETAGYMEAKQTGGTQKSKADAKNAKAATATAKTNTVAETPEKTSPVAGNPVPAKACAETSEVKKQASATAATEIKKQPQKLAPITIPAKPSPTADKTVKADLNPTAKAVTANKQSKKVELISSAAVETPPAKVSAATKSGAEK